MERKLVRRSSSVPLYFDYGNGCEARSYTLQTARQCSRARSAGSNVPRTGNRRSASRASAPARSLNACEVQTRGSAPNERRKLPAALRLFIVLRSLIDHRSGEQGGRRLSCTRAAFGAGNYANRVTDANSNATGEKGRYLADRGGRVATKLRRHRETRVSR